MFFIVEAHWALAILRALRVLQFRTLINNINIGFENKDQAIDFEDIRTIDYKQFLTIINKRMKVYFEEYKELYGNKKEYNFISYEIENLTEGLQIIDDFNINENEILNLRSINVIEKNRC